MPGSITAARRSCLHGVAYTDTADQRVGGFENRRAHEDFQLGDRVSLDRLCLKTGNQLLDFLVLGQKDLGGEVFFLKPVVRSARVCSIMS